MKKAAAAPLKTAANTPSLADANEDHAIKITDKDGNVSYNDGESLSVETAGEYIISILKDFTQTGKWNFSTDSGEIKLTINGNSHTITTTVKSGLRTAFTFGNNVIASLKDLTISASGDVGRDDSSVILTENNAQVSLDNVSVSLNADTLYDSDENNAAALIAQGTSKVEINNRTTISADQTRAIYLEGTSEVNINDGANVNGDYIEVISTGGAENDKPVLNVKGGTVKLNSDKRYNGEIGHGRAINNRGAGTINISGGEVLAEYAKGSTPLYANAILNATYDSGYSGTVNITGGTLKAWGDIILQNKITDITNISGGSLIHTGKYTDAHFVNFGTTNISGGIFNGAGSGTKLTYGFYTLGTGRTDLTDAKKLNISGGTFSGVSYVVFVGMDTSKQPNVTIGGNPSCEGYFLYFNDDAEATTVVQFNDDLKAYVRMYGAGWAYKEKVSYKKISTDGTDKELLSNLYAAYVAAYGGPLHVGYDETDGFLYIYRHDHVWRYDVDGNKITAICEGTDDGTEHCIYTENAADKIIVTVNAQDADWTGEKYKGGSASWSDAPFEWNPTSVMRLWKTYSMTFAGRGDTTYDESSTAPSEPGTYTIKYTITTYDGTKTYTAVKDFTINKLDTTITIKDGVDYSKTYDGKTDAANADDYEVTGSTGNITFVYQKKTESGDWSENLESAPTDAGTYRVCAVVESDNHYKIGTSDYKEFTINKAATTVTIKDGVDYTKTYDGKAEEAKASDFEIKGSDGEVTLVYQQKLENGEWSDILESAPTNAGEYRVFAYVEASDNYELGVSDNVEFTINKAATTVTIKNGVNYSKTYDGKADEAKASDFEIKGSDGEVTLVYQQKLENGEWSDILKSAPTNAGEYRVFAYVEASDNYELGVSDNIYFTISRANPTVTLPKDLTAVEGQKITDIKLPSGFMWLEDVVTGTAGTKTFKAVYIPDDLDNYNIILVDIPVTVTAAPAPADDQKKDPAQEEAKETVETKVVSETTTVNTTTDTLLSTSTSGNPQTADNSAAEAWMLLMGLSGGAAVLADKKRKSKADK